MVSKSKLQESGTMFRNSQERLILLLFSPLIAVTVTDKFVHWLPLLQVDISSAHSFNLQELNKYALYVPYRIWLMFLYTTCFAPTVVLQLGSQFSF